jgi:hypothetical protein
MHKKLLLLLDELKAALTIALLQVDTVLQGSQIRGLSASQASESTAAFSSIRFSLGRLVHAVNGSWAAGIVQGSWAPRADLQSGVSSSPTAFINTTTWCGATWGDSLALVQRLTNLSGITLLGEHGAAQAGNVPDQFREQCKVCFSRWFSFYCLWWCVLLQT